MKALFRRFWFWLAKHPPTLITLGIVLTLGAGITLWSLEFAPNSPGVASRSTSTTASNRYGSSVGGSNGSWTYSQLTAAGANHQLSSLVISGNDGLATTTSGTHYDVLLPDSTAALAQTLDAEGVAVSYAAPNPFTLTNIIEAGLLIILVIAAAWFFLRMLSAQRAASGGFGFGASRARIISPEHINITFADVAGADEAKVELMEIVEFLRDPYKFTALGARIPKGVLLVGSPGTGKTLIAKAVAGESGASFFSNSGSEFVEMFVGVGASRIRDLFAQAKKKRAAIIFVDELDAVGRKRGAGGAVGGGHDEREQTLNQLLVEMDGMDTASHVIILAATNRPDVLDPALLRPGRFDRFVTMENPNRPGRTAILTVHAKNKPLDEAVSLERVAQQTPGLSGAELANLLNEAAILAARHGHKVLTQTDIDEATLRVIAGPEKKSRIISGHEREIIAAHETGHAIVMYKLPGNDPVTRVSVISRGMALGLTLSMPEEDRYLVSRSQLRHRMAGMLGGRAAEALAFNDITSGAENDLQKVTQTAIRMVTEWGMSEKLGQLAMPHGSAFSEQRGVSQALAALIDDEVRDIVSEAYDLAFKTLEQHRDGFDRVRKRLETVSEDIEGPELTTLLAQA